MLQEVRESLRISLPLVITQFTQMGIGVTDTLMIGWLGPTELAALTLATTLLFIFYIWIYGFPNAGVALISQARGRRDLKFARRAFRMGIWLVTISSLISILVLTQVRPILNFFGQEGELIILAERYMVIGKWMILPFMLFTMLRAFMMSVDRIYVIFWISLLGLIFNAFLNYLLIFGNLGAPRLEIEGASIASLGSSSIMLALMFGYSISTPYIRKFQLFKGIHKLDGIVLFRLAKLGFPIGLTTLAEVGSFSAAALMMGWVGKLELAAHGILMQIFGLAFMIPLGISQAATIRIGTAIGRKDILKVNNSRISIYLIGFISGLAIVIALFFLGDYFIKLFLDDSSKDSDQVLKFALTFLIFGLIFHICDCGQILLIGLLRGLSDTSIPFYICLVSYWVFAVPMSYLLSVYSSLGGTGIWIGLGIGMAICFFSLLIRFEVLRCKL